VRTRRAAVSVVLTLALAAPGAWGGLPAPTSGNTCPLGPVGAGLRLDSPRATWWDVTGV
jgi:hypothetical protein